ncbi:MAG: DoxX family membrane protein [Patescibacteria group bacterium]
MTTPKICPSIIVRYAAVALFLWFGIAQLTAPENWVGFLPEWTGYFPMPASMIVQLNGLTEVVLALALGIGVFTRVVAVLLGIHLLGIAITAGGAIGVRDAVLAVMTTSLAFAAPDRLTLDAKNRIAPASSCCGKSCTMPKA